MTIRTLSGLLANHRLDGFKKMPIKKKNKRYDYFRFSGQWYFYLPKLWYFHLPRLWEKSLPFTLLAVVKTNQRFACECQRHSSRNVQCGNTSSILLEKNKWSPFLFSYFLRTNLRLEYVTEAIFCMFFKAYFTINYNDFSYLVVWSLLI